MKCPCEDEMYLCETPCNMESCAYQQGKNDGRAEAVEDFANWLVKYKVIPDGAMAELIRDFNGEREKN